MTTIIERIEDNYIASSNKTDYRSHLKTLGYSDDKIEQICCDLIHEDPYRAQELGIVYEKGPQEVVQYKIESEKSIEDEITMDQLLEQMDPEKILELQRKLEQTDDDLKEDK